MARTKETGDVYQLKITLRNVKPPVWRRVQVRDGSLARLHDVIQVGMGWTNSHLHAFEIRGEQYGEPDPTGMMEVYDERKVKLSQIVAEGVKKFTYTYDFGDGWEHAIEVEKVLPAEPGVPYPRCVAGKRACPPEDCGGPWGYPDFLAALRDPEHPEHEDMVEWIGGEFDPEAFDLDEVNEELGASR
jgi:hypothetical protein